MKNRIKSFIVIFICILIAFACYLFLPSLFIKNIPAFPGAEGAGKWATGGRGGRIIEVTSLNDNGPGSLRAAIEENGPRIVVFRVSGIIDLETALTIKNPDITIAGQTAPGDGICIKGGTFRISSENVIVRYIRIRLGEEDGDPDAMEITSSDNVIIDHCSVSWSVDENLSVIDSDRVTVQYCIISESLNNSVHSEGIHGFGSLIRGSSGASYTFHHNLYAHNYSRNPRPGNNLDHTKDPRGLNLNFINNVVYNWGHRAGYNIDTSSISNYNFVNNYYKKGPSTEYNYIFEEKNPFAKAYFSGNSLDGKIPSDPWKLVSLIPSNIPSYKQARPLNMEELKIESADEAYKRVLEEAGASLARDAVDRRIIDDVRNGTGKIIDSPADVGGWPEYKSVQNSRIPE